MEKRYYIAYGSNLNINQMKLRCPSARIIGTSEVPNYELLFKGSKTGSYLTIEPKEGSSVPVAVWEVSERDELALDRYEGYPHFYYKKEMRLPMKRIRRHSTSLTVESTMKPFIPSYTEHRKVMTGLTPRCGRKQIPPSALRLASTK